MIQVADIVDAKSILELADHQGYACVSLYMPTDPSGRAELEDASRLANLLNRAETDLARDWMRRPEARQLLEPLRSLPRDPAFWQQRGRGLAAFVCRSHRWVSRLGVEFPESVQVDRRFHVLPLLPLLATRERFLILTLSQKRTCLYEANRHWIRPIEVPGMRPNMDQALNYTSVDRGQQVHSASHGKHGKQGAVFHGQGGKSDRQKADLDQYFRLVDAALYPVLRGQEVPLVLAGVDYLIPIFRGVCRYPHLARGHVRGNVDHLALEQVHQRASRVMESAHDEQREAMLRRYGELVGQNKVTDDTREAAEAASRGRVAALLLRHPLSAHVANGDEQSNGAAVQTATAQRETTLVAATPADRPTRRSDVEIAAIETLRNRGVVYFIASEEMPTASPLAAILRYSQA